MSNGIITQLLSTLARRRHIRQIHPSRPNYRPLPGRLSTNTQATSRPPAGPLRRVRYTSFFFHQKALLLWHICWLSLPLDLFLFYVPVHINPRIPETLTILLSIVTFGFIARDRVLDLATTIRAHLQNLHRTTRKYSWIGAAFFFLLAMVEFFVKIDVRGVSIEGIVPIVFALVAFAVIVTRSVRTMRKQMQEQSQHLTLMWTDRIYWVEQVNKQIFSLAIVPIISARLLSISGMLTIRASTTMPLSLIPYLALATLLLLAAYPQREYFVIQCRRCGYWTSRALKGLRGCPKCNRAAFQLVATEDDSALESNNPARRARPPRIQR